MERFLSPEGAEHARRFRARPTDVIIAPDSKSGTTFLQQIAYGICTGGDMSFEEISSAVPWVDTAHDVGIDLDAEQAANPRLFKSHAGANHVPQGARYIVCFRDPLTRIVSLYRFLGDWFFDTDAIGLDEFAMTRLTQPGDPVGYWNKLVSWWRRRDELDALYLTFEDATADRARTVDRVADFLRVSMPADVRERVIRQCSRAFMLEHVNQFDDHLLAGTFVARGVLPPGDSTGKVTAGAFPGLRPSAAVEAAYARAWHEQVAAATGFPDYPAFRGAINQR